MRAWGEGDAYVIARALVDLHGHREDGLGGRVDLAAEAAVGRRDALLDVGRLVGVPADLVLALLVAAAAARLVGALAVDRFAQDGLRSAAGEGALGTLEDDLGARRESGPEVQRFERGRLGEGRGPALDPPGDAAVLLVLLDRQEDEVGHA